MPQGEGLRYSHKVMMEFVQKRHRSRVGEVSKWEAAAQQFDLELRARMRVSASWPRWATCLRRSLEGRAAWLRKRQHALG
jgi:hypothetical protein